MDGRLGRRPYLVRAFQWGKKFLAVRTVVLYSYSWQVTSSFIRAVCVLRVATTPPSVRVVVPVPRLRYHNCPGIVLVLWDSSCRCGRAHGELLRYW